MTPLEEIVVRTATPADEPEVMEMCRELNAENGLFPMNDDQVRAVLRRAFGRQGGVLGLIGAPGSVEAMIFMLISQLWYSDQWHLEELFSFCRPQFRKSHNAKALIQFAMRCSTELHLPLVIGVVTNTRTEQKVALYERQLHSKPNGAFFVFNASWQANGAIHEVGHGRT